MDGFSIAEKITKKHAKTFYFASLFLNKEKKRAAYAVYALCRLSDESVDNSGGASPLENLKNLEQKINAAYADTNLDDALLQAFRQTVNKYKIPKEYFDELIEGMYMDLNKNRYDNFDELYTYCYKVAGVVGLIMLDIFGYLDIKAKDYAVDLGIAMQLTNILRDIKEDFSRRRIYLPKDEMASFGVSETDIAGENPNENFKFLLKDQIARARKYYQASKAGVKLINDANSRFVVCAMADIYSGILDNIEKLNYDVFRTRAHVSALNKVIAVIKILGEGKYRCG